MKRLPKLLTVLSAAAFLLPAVSPAASQKEARVTQIIRDVKLVPSGEDARAAALNDQVKAGIAVRTGDQSRSELTFPDVTINRLGANTIFTFNEGGHSVDLSGGSVLLRVPKASGGGSLRTNAVSVAITGTTVILEGGKGGRAKLMVLEGGARLSLRKTKGQTRDVRAGQMLDVPAGATTLPMPVNIDLNKVMKSHPLITDFPPLPSRDLIAAAAQNPPPPPDDQQGPPLGAPVINIGPSFPGLPFPFPVATNPGRPGRPSYPTGPNHPSSPPRPGGQSPGKPPPSTGKPPVVVGNTPPPKYQPTPPPRNQATPPPKYQPTPPPMNQATPPPKYQPTPPPKQTTPPPIKRVPPKPRSTATPPVVR